MSEPWSYDRGVSPWCLGLASLPLYRGGQGRSELEGLGLSQGLRSSELSSSRIQIKAPSRSQG